MKVDKTVTPKDLAAQTTRLFALAGQKIHLLQRSWNPQHGTPVFTVNGVYTSRGWTEWTQGFQFGSAILQFDATGDADALAIGKSATVDHMATHVSHIGVHDHGFNNISTYGNLRRLMLEGRIPENAWEQAFYDLALKVSGAVQAARWTDLGNGEGYVYSFNGPHSLFADTIRSLRVLALAHQLGHVLMGEKDRKISLLERLVTHAFTTSRYNVYFGEERDAYDIRGRVAHESIFNVNDGSYRCPSSQQGYSPFSTWTRGQAWILCGFAEELGFLAAQDEGAMPKGKKKAEVLSTFLSTAEAVADHYIGQTPLDGIPYWDTGAPGLARMGDIRSCPADPFNAHEPVDSSAAVIAAQGLIRLGLYLQRHGKKDQGTAYLQAGLTVAKNVFTEPYLSLDPKHQGLILHSVYHRPNGWDHIPAGKSVPCNEATMWGDYHAMELGLLITRMAEGKPELKFWQEKAPPERI
jgi:hypothetical protein